MTAVFNQVAMDPTFELYWSFQVGDAEKFTTVGLLRFIK